MYKKILLPTDGSDESKKAIRYVKEVAKKFNSDVLLLYVYKVSDEVTRIIGEVDKGLKHQLEDMEKHLKDHGHAVTENISKELSDEGINVSHLIVKGDAGHEIVKAVDNQGCDLIVMGSRGMGTIKSALIGSTSNYVVHHTKCPIMVVQK